MKKNILLILILVLAAAVRLVNLSSMPPSLNWDEISHGYNAYSILKTGSDEWGQALPIANFRAYGDYPLPLNLYLTIPFVALLGLNELSIRLPHALLGVFAVVSSYYAVFAFTKRKEASLLAAFLVATTPWYVFTSRFVLQSNLSVFLLTTFLALFLNRKKNKLFVPASLICLGLTLFSYHSTRIFTPLLLVALIILYRKVILNKINIFIIALFFVPLPFILLNPTARARSNEVFLLNQNVVYSIEVARNNSQLPDTFKRLVYNRPVYLVSNFAKNYVGYFSPQFLFLSGGTQYQFSLPNHGVLYLVELPFFYFGLILLIKRVLKRKDKESLFLLSWLFFSPIPASITTEANAVVRSTTMLPIPEILVVVGFLTFINLLKKKSARLFKVCFYAFVLFLFCSLGFYIYKYGTSYKKDYSWAWQYGYKEVINYATSHYQNYDRIILTKYYGEPHEYVLFFSSFDPTKYKNDANLIRFTQSNWWWVDSFDKYVFVNDWQIPHNSSMFITESKVTVDCNKLKCLLITTPENAPSNWRKIQTVYFLDSKPSFEIYEN